MNKLIWALVALLCLVGADAAVAQQVQVSRENRTIELTADSSVEVLADAVSITVGYHNYGPTNDAAYAENMRIADQILKSWIDAGVPENQISTHSLSMERVSDSDLKETDAADRKQRQFEATQEWTLTAKTEIAQRLLDLAVLAGANEVSDPEWKLSDPDAAERAAYASALEKAHGIAEQMARSFGAKAGALLYATNQSRAVSLLTSLGVLNTESAIVASRSYVRPPAHPVKLLPHKIQRNVVVRAIFALE